MSDRAARRLGPLVFLLAGGLPSALASQLTLYAPAKTSLPSLGVPVGVRAIGMGEAYTAVGSDVYALHWNPAGLARIAGHQLGLAHNEWSSALGLRQEFLAYGQSLGRDSGLAISVNYFDLGKLERRSATGELTGGSTAFAFSGTIGYGQGLLDQRRLKLGAALGSSLQSLFDSSQTVLAGSLGLLYEFDPKLHVAAALKHLGSGNDGFMPPTTVDVGLSSLWLARRLTLALDLSLPFNADPSLHAGTELNFGVMAVRGGWRQGIGSKPGDVQSGLSAGMGFTLGLFELDYAFVPYGELSSTHRVAATLCFPANFFDPKVVSTEHSTATAKAHYENAKGKQASGSMMEAMIQYERAVEAYPIDRFKEAPHDFYLDSRRRILDLRAQMSGTGQSEGARKEIQRRLTESEGHLLTRNYKNAILSAVAVLTLDPANSFALKLKAEAESGQRSRKSGLVADAKASYSAGRLAQAIVANRDVLSIDAGDPQALAFFRQNKAEIIAYLQTIQRRGIDAYVAGKPGEAVTLWEGGMRLDPSDPLNMGRDIDKARKLMEMKKGK